MPRPKAVGKRPANKPNPEACRETHMNCVAVSDRSGQGQGMFIFLAGHTHKLVVNDYKGMQLVNGETTSRNFDKRPMGFRWWDVAAQGKMIHRFVAIEGMDE